MSEASIIIYASQLNSLKEAARYAAAREGGMGAAVLCQNGNIHSGTYLQGRTAASTVHAEAAAIISSLLQGDNAFIALALFSMRPSRSAPLAPCGACLQFLSEHAMNPELCIVTSSMASLPAWDQTSLRELFPRPWRGWA